MRTAAIWAVGALCVSCKDPPAAKPDASPPVAATSAPTPTPSALATPSAPATASTAPSTPVDAGANACKLVYGPLKLGTGPVAVAGSADGVRVAFNVAGAATVSIAPKTAADAKPGAIAGSSPPCALTETSVFCMDKSGGLHRTDPRTGGGKVVGQARPGTRIGAASVGGHDALVFLRDRKTSEGVTMEAWLWTDDDKTQRLSDDGSGATFATMAPRGSGALVLMLDARSAMTPVHARSLSFGGTTAVGPDAVVFLGGGAEPDTRASLAVPKSGPAYALLPISHDIGFGLAVARIDGEPKTDEPVVWSDYKNGLDPAPIAGSSNAANPYVARVVPQTSALGSPRVIELGRIDDKGAFASYGSIAPHGSPSEVSLAADGADLIVAYSDDQGAWIERRTCP